MAETRSLSLEVTVPAEQYETMVGAICRAGGYAETSEANARATVLAWARATVQNVLLGDAERAAQAAVEAEKARVDAALDAVAALSASQTEGATSRTLVGESVVKEAGA